MAQVKLSTKVLITNRVIEVMEINSDLFSDEAKKLILATINNGGNSAHIKINGEGQVYCNYFQKYLPKEKFRLQSDGKYPANSIKGEQNKRAKARLKKVRDDALINLLLSEVEDMDKAKAKILATYETEVAKID